MMYRASIALLLLAICIFYMQTARAQIAPTNSATISGSVSDSTGKPVADAKVSLSGPKTTSMQTDVHGLFDFVGVPFGTYQISAAAAGLGNATRNISVTGDTNVAIQYEPISTNGLKTIAHVSSNSPATFNVTPASITQVNPMQNAFAGKTSWRTILEQIPGVAYTGSGSGNYAIAGLPDGPLTPVQISINGTLPYETSTLLDDMPLIGGNSNPVAVSAASPGQGTDLSFYPLNAFSAADVVRGPGANAPSIVDSIGGSFVLHAPMAVNRNHYDFSTSTDPYGGTVSNAQVAVRWKKLSVVMTYGINDSPGPISSAGILAKPIFAPLTVNGQIFTPYLPPCSPPSCQFGSYLLNPNYAGFPIYGFLNGLQIGGINQSFAWSQHGGSLALNYEFSPSVSAEVFYVGQVSLAPCPNATEVSIFEPPAGYAGSFPSGAHMLSEASYFLSSNTFRQGSSLFEEKITARLGMGILRFSALQNRTLQSTSLTVPSSATVRLFGGGVYCTDPSCTSTTPAIFNGGLYTITLPQLGIYGQGTTNNRDLLLSYALPFGESLHAGISFVKSYYNMPSEFLYQCDGVPLFGASLPSAISQTTNEARIFVGSTLGNKTSLDLSMYFANADYHVQNPDDSSGGTYVDERYTYTAPRLGFVWRPTATIAVRAAAGGGFAEAPLGDLVGTNGAPSCGGSFCSVMLTNVNLQPEKSFAFNLGADLRLRHNTVVSLDVYRSKLYGQIYNATLVTGTYLGLPLYTTQYGNLGESRYEGILVDVRHEVPHGLFWSLSGGLTRGYVVSLPAGFYNIAGGTCDVATGANCTNLTVVPNINFNGQFAGSIPYAQGLGRLGYRWNADRYLDLVATYYGNNNTYYRPAFVELDGHVGYPLTKNAALMVTFRNITGIYDGTVQTWSLANFSGAPTITGAPYPLWGEEYGPRTAIVTLNVHI